MFDRLDGLRQAGRDVGGPDVYSVFPELEDDIHARLLGRGHVSPRQVSGAPAQHAAVHPDR